MADVPSTNDENATSATPAPAAHKTRLGVKVFAVVGVLVVLVVLATGSFVFYKVEEAKSGVKNEQAALEPFYTPPATIPPKPGTIIRSEKMPTDVPGGGTAYRVLYTSLDKDKKPVAVSGMIFVSDKAAARGTRKIIGWAHGTVGLADQCAPSRAANPLNDTEAWLDVAMERGYVVAATDYLGLGTPGEPTYLIGEQEAQDVVNSVRAAKTFVKGEAGNDWIVWGHSQGGHSALWTGTLAEKIAPELNLIAVGAAAPAQQLKVIMQQQWPTAVGWVIGPEALLAFEAQYPDRNFRGIISQIGQDRMDSILGQCVQLAGLQGLAIDSLGGKYFTQDPLTSPAWAKTALEQTPPILPPSMPLFLSEGTNDQVVLSGSNALMQEEWCKAGSQMTVEWLGGVGHMQVAIASGPAFMEWAIGQFEGKRAPVNCSYPPASPALEQVQIAPEVLAAPASVASVVVPSESPSASNSPSGTALPVR